MEFLKECCVGLSIMCIYVCGYVGMCVAVCICVPYDDGGGIYVELMNEKRRRK